MLEPRLTRSEAERRLVELVRAARLPLPVTNMRLSPAGKSTFLAATTALVVEVDGFAFHGNRAAFERDRARDATLVAAGYRVVRITWRQLADEPHAVVALLPGSCHHDARCRPASSTRPGTRSRSRPGRADGPLARHRRAIQGRACADAVRPSRLTPATIVEIGCGDGSLLVELARLATVDGFELSANAAAYRRDRGVARSVEAFDGDHVPARDGAYDLAILSHVVEHVPDPLPLLKEAARVARHVIVEVPLEDNRSAKRPAKRELSEAAGHLHAYDPAPYGAVERGRAPTAQELTDPLSYEHLAFFGGARRVPRSTRSAPPPTGWPAHGGAPVHRPLRRCWRQSSSRSARVSSATRSTSTAASARGTVPRSARRMPISRCAEPT